MPRQKTTHKHPGFTIVELLIVVVVIAILAAITIVAYNGVTKRAEASAVQTSLNQAATKLELYKVDNDAYPAALSDAGVTDGGGVTYYYAPDNTVTPATYCMTATKNTTNYLISSSNTSPTSGSCQVTNLAIDPRATTYTTSTPGWFTTRWWGSSPAAGNYSIVSGAADGPQGITTYARKTWTTAPPSFAACSDTGFQFASTQPGTLFSVTPGATMTFSAYVRASRQANVNMDAYMFNSFGGDVTPIGWNSSRANNNGGAQPGVSAQVAAAAPGSWTRISLTMTIPTGVANLMVIADRDNQGQNGAQQWQVGDTFDVTGLMITKSSTLATYADGNSPGWLWNGTPNASTSTGSAL